MSEQNLSAEDLSLVSETDDGGGEDGAAPAAAAETAEQKPAEPAADDKKPAAAADEQKPAADTKPAPAAKKTLVSGANSEDEPAKEPAKEYWPADWREKAAEHIAAGDKKAYDRELRRLQRIASPEGMYGMYRELEGKFTGGGLLKIPGKDAKPEEIAEFHKALGVPEKSEDYFQSVKLENGAVIGDADKPLVDGFAAAVHKSGATPAFVNAALNWYYTQQEEQAAALDEADDAFQRESEQALKEEYGPAFRRNTNAISSIFASAPGGADVSNENSLVSRLMGGRMADGRIIGNDPDMIRFLVAISHDINPASSVVEDGDQTGQSIETEIAKIEKRMREDRHGYYKDENQQARYRDLLTARDKIRDRSR